MDLYKEFFTPDDVNNWVLNNYSKDDLDYLNVVKNKEASLGDYKGNYFKRINEYLRKGLEEKQTTFDIIGIKRMIEKYEISENILVIRFIDIRELVCLIWNTRCGKKYEYPCLLSTTLLKEHFAMDDIKQGRLAITILAPKGTLGTYVPEVNTDCPEYEVLFPYRIKLKRISWRKYIIENEVIQSNRLSD